MTGRSAGNSISTIFLPVFPYIDHRTGNTAAPNSLCVIYIPGTQLQKASRLSAAKNKYNFMTANLLLLFQTDTTAVDTTSRGYEIGYTIGSWLPFLIIFTLALMVIIRSYRLSQRDEG